jgi:PTH1 family peptidyl-tRNA hydrolase
MKLIAGLGNPEEKYKNTRHNLGFLIVDEFAKRKDFPCFEFSKKFNALISENDIDGKRVVLTKPQTYMNNSGQSLKSLTVFYKIRNEDVIVVHDDIDLLFGEIKVSEGRGSAGHKGVESIIKELGTKDFKRIRAGILPKEGKTKETEDFVLESFTKEEKDTIKEIAQKAVKAIEKEIM